LSKENQSMVNLNKSFLRYPGVYFGNKSKIASEVWKRLGNVDTYIEPFCGSASMLWKRPLAHFADGKARIEILNDKYCHAVNFLRTIKYKPEVLVKEISTSVASEVDLIARYRYLAFGHDKKGFSKKLKADPEYCEPVMAAWWVWGMCLWIGNDNFQALKYDNWRKIPECTTRKGICVDFNIDICSENFFSGNDRYIVSIKNRHKCIHNWINTLHNRLLYTTIACGKWSRVCEADSIIRGNGTKRVGVFLDPPYPTKSESGVEETTRDVYSKSKSSFRKLQKNVMDWCIKNANEKVRVAVCGYEGNGYELLVKEHSWTEMKWSTIGGYANTGKNEEKSKKKNRFLERIWFSPNCIKKDSFF